jgi:antitoxin component YwqK of YwqJK toxin-antitoxin module
MKNIILLFVAIITICVSCTSINYPNHPKWLCSKRIDCDKHLPLFLEEKKKEAPISFFNNSPTNMLYEDFPNEDSTKSDSDYRENFADGTHRAGKIRENYKEGKWLSGNVDLDSSGNVYAEGKIWKEEYFKRGLRDSIFKQFDINGNLIFSTYFKMGTGLWKEFHKNGKIYFEIATRDGYFTDTLKLYNDKGKLMEKRLYKKDSLVYRENFIFDENPTDNK